MNLDKTLTVPRGTAIGNLDPATGYISTNDSAGAGIPIVAAVSGEVGMLVCNSPAPIRYGVVTGKVEGDPHRFKVKWRDAGVGDSTRWGDVEAENLSRWGVFWLRTWQVGDVVRIVEQDSTYVGRVGVVVARDPGVGLTRVALVNQDHSEEVLLWWAHDEHLVPAGGWTVERGEDLEEFKRRASAAAMEKAQEYDWCSVVTDLLRDLDMPVPESPECTYNVTRTWTIRARRVDTYSEADSWDNLDFAQQSLQWDDTEPTLDSDWDVLDVTFRDTALEVEE